jgi:type II secretory pathway component PulK
MLCQIHAFLVPGVSVCVFLRGVVIVVVVVVVAVAAVVVVVVFLSRTSGRAMRHASEQSTAAYADRLAIGNASLASSSSRQIIQMDACRAATTTADPQLAGSSRASSFGEPQVV